MAAWIFLRATTANDAQTPTHRPASASQPSRAWPAPPVCSPLRLIAMRVLVHANHQPLDTIPIATIGSVQQDFMRGASKPLPGSDTSSPRTPHKVLCALGRGK